MFVRRGYQHCHTDPSSYRGSYICCRVLICETNHFGTERIELLGSNFMHRCEDLTNVAAAARALFKSDGRSSKILEKIWSGFRVVE